MTKIQQYGQLNVDKATEISELKTIGFYHDNWSDQNIFEKLIRRALVTYHGVAAENEWLREHLATSETDVLTFFEQEGILDRHIFYTIAAQLLGFEAELAVNNYDGKKLFEKIGLETVAVSDIYHAWYILLNTHTKNGLLWIDDLASHGYFEANNQRLLFNGKSMVTYDTKYLIQETVWVETTVDSDGDGRLDLIQVDIQRPNTTEKLPVLFTASPYYQGMMVQENDAKIHSVNQPLTHKAVSHVTGDMANNNEELTSDIKPRVVSGQSTKATKTFVDLAGKAWDLNNYFLSRGYAVAYASGVGTRHSDGMQDTGSPMQVESMKNVVEWLAGDRVAFTDRTSQIAIKADWSNHKIAMTGRSYLGTLATAVATTGVKGLQTIISEAAISDWYQYYRDNGLVIAPGGFPGEDMDVLAELVFSRMKDPADWLRNKKQWQLFQENTTQLQDRQTGNYNAYWDSRNYLNHTNQINIDIVSVHGLNDWNVKPRQVYRLWQALRDNGHHNKLILHQGQHININDNASLDFADQMNLWFTEKLLGVDVGATNILPTVTWQDNTQVQTWHKLTDWGDNSHEKTYHFTANQLVSEPTKGTLSFTDGLPEGLFKQYTKNFNQWREQTLKQAPALANTQLHFKCETLSQSQFIDGETILNLRVKSSQNVGLISVMLVDYGLDNYLKPNLTRQNVAIDRGMNFAKTPLQEFESQKGQYKMISIGHINLQNRHSAWQNDDLLADEYVSVKLTLQPTMYRLRASHQLGVIIYATDFEMTIRGNQAITYTIDLAHSSLMLPIK